MRFTSPDWELKNFAFGSSMLPGQKTGKDLSDMFINVMRKFKINFNIGFGFIKKDGARSAKRQV